MVITYRIPTLADLKKVSEQIMLSYVSAYEGLMDHEYLSTLKADHWESVLQESIQNGDTCLIAEYNGIIIGSTVFGTVSAGDEIYAQWHAFYLLPQYIGIGIGHSFYQKIEEEMIRQKCKRCILEVLSSNKRAIKFYISHGFAKSELFDVEENDMILLCNKMTKDFK
ncbi:MAG: GCN5-related N-acetyltransferase [Lacrimispora sp.]|nr:GCN5-related N-acetyltransferase [Lacrimispora sp.]